MNEGKSWAKYVAIGCTAVLLLGACGLGLMYYSCNAAYEAATAPSDAAGAFLADLHSGNIEAAYARMSETFRAHNDLETFEAILADHPALTSQSTVTFTSHVVDLDGATLGGFLEVEGRPVGIQMRMVKGADQTYYVDGMVVDEGPAPSEPAPEPTR